MNLLHQPELILRHPAIAGTQAAVLTVVEVPAAPVAAAQGAVAEVVATGNCNWPDNQLLFRKG
jgi:hypothetical protein